MLQPVRLLRPGDMSGIRYASPANAKNQYLSASAQTASRISALTLGPRRCPTPQQQHRQGQADVQKLARPQRACA